MNVNGGYYWAAICDQNLTNCAVGGWKAYTLGTMNLCVHVENFSGRWGTGNTVPKYSCLTSGIH